MSSPRNLKSGFAFVAVVFILLTLSILGIALAGLYSTSAKISVEILQGTEALVIADSGLRWLFQHELFGDRDFTDNNPPTDPPFGDNSVQWGNGNFWVEYHDRSKIEITFTITARVGNAVRRVYTAMKVRPPEPLRRAVTSTSHNSIPPGVIDLRKAGNNPLSGVGIIGDIEATGFIQMPSGTPPYVLTHIGRKYPNSPYTKANPAVGMSYGAPINLSWFEARADAIHDGELIFSPSGNNSVRPNNSGNHIWYVKYPGSVIFDGNGPGNNESGNISITGTLVVDNAGVSTRDNPIILWEKGTRNIDGVDGDEILPAIAINQAAFSFGVDTGASAQINGMVVADQWTFHIKPGITTAFKLDGLLWATESGIGISPAGTPPDGSFVSLEIAYDPVQLPQSPYDTPWLDIQGPDPDVDYLFTSYEVISP